MTEDSYEDFYYRHHGSASVNSDSKQYYDTEDQQERNYYHLLSFTSEHSVKKELDFEPKSKRDFCIKEMVETEGDYLQVLIDLRRFFIIPIDQMTEEDKKVVFINVGQLQEMHTQFYQV